MLIAQKHVEGIRDGRITVAFRRWRRPTVKAGGTLLMAAGQLEIVAVTSITLEDIPPADVARAGYESAAELLRDLTERDEGDFYRIDFGALKPDPRVALREVLPDGDARRELEAKLAKLDARAEAPWTRRVLEIIAARPGVNAATLAKELGVERDPFKANVRKLKALGLTESLDVGYRLSPRGCSLLR